MAKLGDEEIVALETASEPVVVLGDLGGETFTPPALRARGEAPAPTRTLFPHASVNAFTPESLF